MIYLDTHVAVWLVVGAIEKFTASANKLIESAEIFISPIVLLEIEYLYEIKRVKQNSKKFKDVLESELDVQIARTPYLTVVQGSITEKWTRDPFDRLIVAQAKVDNAQLVSADTNIRDNYERAIW